MDQSLQRIDVEVGAFVVLMCKVVSGAGNITVRWMIDGKPVENGRYTQTTTVREMQSSAITSQL